MTKAKLFISELVPGAQTIFLVGYARKSLDVGQTLFTNELPGDFHMDAHEFVADIASCDYVLFPHAVKSKHDPLRAAVERARASADAAGKPLLVFVGGDLSHDVFIDGVIVLKGSQYGHLRRANEIIVPPISVDFAESFAIVPRPKGERPVVSFCGWAGFASASAYGKYVLRNLATDLLALLRPAAVVHKKGLYWRRRALAALSGDARIDTRFIVRTSFSANAKTISLDPTTARREYVENMRDSDYVLAPKGDGNFSVRFYEAISMGRIPILIDTDVVLPLADSVDYGKFVLRVPWQDAGRIADIVAEFHARLSDEEFRAMQAAARAAFAEHLRYDRFFDELFSRVLPAYIASTPAR